MVEQTQLEKMVEQALEILVLFDETGKIRYANKTAAELLAYEEGLWGQKITDIFPEEIQYEGDRLLIKEPLNKTSQMMAYRQNRTCFSVEARISSAGAGLFLCAALDVSHREFFERQASRSDQQANEARQIKTQFVANVTHELRTPVNGILGNVRELLEQEKEEGKKKKLRLIERGCEDMHSLINNILDFSKLDAGKFELEIKPFKFFEMMEYVKAIHQNKITEKGIRFVVNVAPDVPEEILGDEMRIRQVLNNFISNAAKFTYTGKITVEVMKTSQIADRVELFFIVIDTGIGIAREDQEKLFQSFTQVEASTTRKFGGTGLGLSICKQLVELMDGKVHLESEKGRGSMFSFHIWVQIPVPEGEELDPGFQSFDVKMPSIGDMTETSLMLTFGTKENLDELQKKLSKFILCVDMGNWEKAEFFMESVKQLSAEAPKEIKSSMLRLKMAVQKGDYEKTSKAYEKMSEQIQQLKEERGDGL